MNAPWTVDGIWRHPSLSPAEKLFAIAVYERRGSAGAELDRLVRVSATTRGRIVKKLEKRGIIRVVTLYGKHGKHHEYLPRG